MDMKYRPLGRTGWNVSEISFGAWAIGGTWGTVSDDESMDALHKAVDCGVNFIDTADVYGDGRSERLVASLVRSRPDTRIYVATKFGRRLNPHTAEGYNAANLEAFLDRSLTNLQTETVDLVQLHCPPSSVYETSKVFDICDRLVQKGKLRHYGVSVEKVSEAIKAVEYPGVQSVQIIYNLFRQRPAEEFFPLAKARQVGILARLPLSSGMLTGKITRETSFEPDDHRAGNREGEWFDKGETFSGVPFEVGLQAVEELQSTLSTRPLAGLALRWILMNDAVTCAIPGGKRPSQVEENCSASDLPALRDEQMEACKRIYQERIRALVHELW
jgi:aryl-alcohol dehydrogenase-like predicted oxidoreductase